MAYQKSAMLYLEMGICTKLREKNGLNKKKTAQIHGLFFVIL